MGTIFVIDKNGDDHTLERVRMEGELERAEREKKDRIWKNIKEAIALEETEREKNRMPCRDDKNRTE